MVSEEIALTGGRVTQNVTRKGDIVYRPCCSNSDFVHRVLQWLEAKQIQCTPKFLGIAGDGREMTSFLEGISPPDLDHFNTNQLEEAAKIIRTLHDAASDFPGCGLDQTVCHYDLSPCNFMFQNDLPYAVFDWDAAGIGDPLEDIAYAVWMWCDTGYTLEENGPDEVGKQVRTFIEAYGLDRDQWTLLPDAMYRQMRRVAKSLGESNNLEGKQWAEYCERILRKHENDLIKAILDSSHV